MKQSKFFNALFVVVIVLSMTFGALGSTPAKAASQDFQILSLTANVGNLIEHVSATGDDRGGIAVSSSNVFYTGDNATGRFALADLSGATSVGAQYDGLTSDLSNGQVYTLGTASGPISNGGDPLVTRLLVIDGSTGSLTGGEVTLSSPITVTMDPWGLATGVFAGYGRVLVHNSTHVYEIALPSGQVTDLGALNVPSHTICENWAYWGVAEHFGGEDYVTYVQDPQTIARMRVSDGAISTVATFSSLGDMCSFTVSPSNNRWYFHHEHSSQFTGSNDESLGYADATFSTSPVPPTPPAAFGKSAPAHGTVDVSTSSTLSWAASEGAASYEYCIDADKNSTCDSSWISVDGNTSVDLSGLSNETSYSWQVRAVNADGTTYADAGAEMPWWSFATVAQQSGGSTPAYYPFGPQTNVDENQLTGWTLCWSSSYGSTDNNLDTILAACNGDYLLLGGKPTGSTVFDVVAAGPRADVLFHTGDGDYYTLHEANGVGWYFSYEWSWGFVKAGDPVQKFSCDVMGDPNSDLRLCWHTWSHSIQGGYRSGATMGASDGFDRFIYQSNGGGSVPTPPGDFSKSAPEADATDVSRGPQLSWATSDGATTYEYCIDADLDTTCDSAWLSTDANTSVDLFGLDYATSYSWQVRAINADGTTEANTGTWWHFTTLPIPVPDTFIDPEKSEVNGTSATFSFYSDMEANFQCSLDESEWTSCTSPVQYDGLAEGSHFFAVRAYVGETIDPSPATYEFNVAVPHILTVTANSQSKTYGDTDPEFTFSYSGFEGEDNASVLTQEPTCSVIDAGYVGNVGEYTIACDNGSDDYYSFDYVSSTLTVGKATLDVTANDQSMTAGDADPEYTFAYNGFKYEDGAGSLTTEPSCSVAVDHSTAGSYDITCSGGSADNYNFSYTNGTLTVNPAAPTVYAATFTSLASSDGWIQESSETSNKGGVKYAANLLRVGDTANNSQYRSFIHFDTSSLPEGAIITSVTLKVKSSNIAGVNPFTKLGNILVDVKQGAFSNNPALQLADFQAKSSQDEAAMITNSPDANKWYSASFNESAFSFINLSGGTQFRLRFQKDDNNNHLANYIRFYAGNAAESNRPQLIVEYTLP